MLEQLIESKNNGKETAKRAKFLGTTFVLVVSLAFSGVLWSLFAKDIAMSGSQFELSTMLAPVSIPEIKPQPPEPAQKQPKTEVKNTVNETSRQANILRLDENPKIPKEISVVKNTQQARPNAPFIISKGIETNAYNSSANLEKRGDDAGGNGIGEKIIADESKVVENKIPEPPPLKIKKIEPPKATAVKSGGVMNGKATSLPKPIYSAAARAVNASGEVNVQIMVDENGKVISANAVSGHPLLRGEAEKAARNARFSPTLLSNEPVKVTGLIIYKFSK